MTDDIEALARSLTPAQATTIRALRGKPSTTEAHLREMEQMRKLRLIRGRRFRPSGGRGYPQEEWTVTILGAAVCDVLDSFDAKDDSGKPLNGPPTE